MEQVLPYLNLYLHLSLNRGGSWGTTDDFTTSFLHFSLFSAPLWGMASSRLVHSLMLSSHFFFCLPCLLHSLTVPCKMVLARPDERETCPYHCSLRFFTMIRKSSCGPIACWILAQTSSLVTWSLYETRSILRKHPISMTCILLWSSAVSVHDPQAYRKMDLTRELISPQCPTKLTSESTSNISPLPQNSNAPFVT